MRRMIRARCARALLLSAAVTWACPRPADAAPAATPSSAATVYPVFEGWTPNPDGTATLVFGYFSESPRPVEIAPGPGNSFSPGPEDRGQPSLFRPGRQRNVCWMVVGEEIGGDLRWTIEWNGVATATTEKGVRDPIYLLEAIGGAARIAREIDTASAPRGLCLDRPPAVRAGADQKTAARSTVLEGFVLDEGLPRGGTLSVSWRLVSGPGTATFESPSEPRTRVDFGAPGTYELELSASDSASTASDRIVVEAGAGAGGVEASSQPP
jgi:hypothetical protein